MQNLGTFDRAIRIGLGLGLVGATSLAAGLWWLGLPGLALLATAVTGYCPLYHAVQAAARRVTP